MYLMREMFYNHLPRSSPCHIRVTHLSSTDLVQTLDFFLCPPTTPFSSLFASQFSFFLFITVFFSTSCRLSVSALPTGVSVGTRLQQRLVLLT